MEDLTGNKYGRLTILKYSHNVGTNSFWICKCECGNIKAIQGTRMKKGSTKSCGCYSVEVSTKHGNKSGGKESGAYTSWRGMIDRCTNPNADNYQYYGGRGISICERWLDFSNFLEDMGERPLKGTIERKNNSKGYFPENCAWACRRKQANNTRRNHYITYKGKQMSIAEASRIYGIPYYTLRSRIYNYKWDIEKAIETPTKGKAKEKEII